MTKGLIVDLSGDKPRLGKKGPKGWNKHTPEGAEDGAPNEVSAAQAPAEVRKEGQPVTYPSAGKTVSDEIIDYAKALTVVEIKAFLVKNGIEVDMNAPNGGVAKMRAMNAIRSAVKGGKTLVK